MDSEPKVTLLIREYVEISYKDQKIVMPKEESFDLLKPIAQLMPDDIRAKS